MDLLRTRDELDAWRNASTASVALVPTMGALHDGHLSHIQHARANAERVIVSIFVNPTQFGPNEDFERYPRDLDRDLKLCEAHGAHAVFVPDVETVYPPDQPAVEINVPSVAAELEGAERPGHFAGVCRVVMKLFGLVRPDVATFGRKDYQQLTVIKAVVADLAVPVRIVEVPTTREPDGLAMSSRNVYLTPEQRQRALTLNRSLTKLKDAVDAAPEVEPTLNADELEAQLLADLHAGGVTEVDYAVVRHARTLAPLKDGFDPRDAVALLACRFGQTRLIDNRALG